MNKDLNYLLLPLFLLFFVIWIKTLHMHHDNSYDEVIFELTHDNGRNLVMKLCNKVIDFENLFEPQTKISKKKKTAHSHLISVRCTNCFILHFSTIKKWFNCINLEGSMFEIITTWELLLLVLNWVFLSSQSFLTSIR